MKLITERTLKLTQELANTPEAKALMRLLAGANRDYQHSRSLAIRDFVMSLYNENTNVNLNRLLAITNGDEREDILTVLSAFSRTGLEPHQYFEDGHLIFSELAACLRNESRKSVKPARKPEHPAITQEGRNFDVDQAAGAIEDLGDKELAARVRHAWKVQCELSGNPSTPPMCFEDRKKDQVSNLLISYGMHQDYQAADAGFIFLGAAKDSDGREVHVFQKKALNSADAAGKGEDAVLLSQRRVRTPGAEDWLNIAPLKDAVFSIENGDAVVRNKDGFKLWELVPIASRNSEPFSQIIKASLAFANVLQKNPKNTKYSANAMNPENSKNPPNN